MRPPGGMGEQAGMMIVVNWRVGSSWLAVATPRARGTTSTIWYWWEASMAAPIAMASSGLMRRQSSLLANMLCRMSCTLGMRLDPPTSSTWSTSSAFMPPCTLSRARRTGSLTRSSRSLTRLSNSSRVILASSVSSWKSSSRQMSLSVMRDRSTLSCAAAVRSLFRAFFFLSPSLAFARSTPVCLWKTWRKWSTRRASMSSPPRRVSPSVARTWKFMELGSICMMVTSSVPPPKSNTRRVLGLVESVWSTPNASAAAVGSLMIRLTSRPAMRPASRVAWRWESLK
mmetsp:Transcript_54153/g.126492  ORF Transcript_54153/g.126492 Transcript_54153/m.126492 type:complete len:285 (-) Transcript_54153:510-1364(-)